MFDFAVTKTLHLYMQYAKQNLLKIGKELKNLETLNLHLRGNFYAPNEEILQFKTPSEAYDMLPENLVLKDLVVISSVELKLSAIILGWKPKAAMRTEIQFWFYTFC